MMGIRANDISSARRDHWQQTGWMPWDDDAMHRDFPLSWKWVEESEALWARRFTIPPTGANDYLTWGARFGYPPIG